MAETVILARGATSVHAFTCPCAECEVQRARVAEARKFCACCGVRITLDNWSQRGVYNCSHR